ncbi:MAG: 15-cis-phytoene synthase [Candidatus Sumerlaeota bacterium]|nr:15-cis-phytoene synthase [Candidatus Sumerlaeota bacterium]
MPSPLATFPPLPRLALRLLPREHRKGVRAVLEYHGAVGVRLRRAFPRGAEAMQAVNAVLQAELAPGGGTAPRTPGLAVALAGGVPRRHLVPVVDGWNAYLLRRRPRDQALFENTLRLLAGAPARAIGGLLGLEGTESTGPVEALGMGLGMTQMLRLLGPALHDGRLHFPEEDAERFRANLQDLADGRCTKAVQDLLWFETKRARDFLARGEQAVEAARGGPAASYLAVHLAWGRGVLDRLESAGFDVVGRDVEMSRWEALRLCLRRG